MDIILFLFSLYGIPIIVIGGIIFLALMYSSGKEIMDKEQAASAAKPSSPAEQGEQISG